MRDIYEKVEAGQRISDDDCLRLFRSHDLAAIGAMANLVRERKNGNVAYYILNRHINYSNICILDCDFCAFYRRRRDAGAYEYNLPQMIEKAKEALKLGHHRDSHRRRAASVVQVGVLHRDAAVS